MNRKDGSSYNGSFVDGKRDGSGTETNKTGYKLKANWEKDTIVGDVKVLYSNGDQYEGKWDNHKRNGAGKIVYSNGDSFEGIWSNGRRYGKGIFTPKNGFAYSGKWTADKISRLDKMLWNT